MVDRSFFGRLTRLFSTNSIVVQTGKNTVKVLDTNNSQQVGSTKSNNFTDRYSRLYSSSNNVVGAFGSSVGGFQQGMLRTDLYNEYQMMDNDSIISSALDVIASLSTLSNTEGNILKIRTNDETIKITLENLFYDILNIEQNAFGWIRDMSKFGDNFLFLKIQEGYGIVGITPMSPYMTNIVEDEKTGEITYTFDQNMSKSFYANKEGFYKNFEIAHFKLNGDINYYPYSKSYIEGARKAWKMLTLMEDASLIHRLMRSSDKRKFFIDVGNIPPNEVDAFMQKIVNDSKKTPFVDPQTGDYNLKYNMMNLLEDYYLPVRGKNSGTNIENISGLSFAGMDDVLYHKQKVYNGLKIPKAFLSETNDLNGTSTLANMTVNFSNLIERIQKAFVVELEKLAVVHLYARGITDNNMLNFELKLTPPSIIYEQERITTLQEKISLVQNMIDTNLLSSDYIYHNILNISEDEYDEIRDGVLEDKKREFRINQIQTEGNDPLQSGKSYGTPHDLANLYNNKVHVNQAGVPNTDDVNLDTSDLGRPSEHGSTVGTDNNNFGRDPLFKARKDNTSQQVTLNPSKNNISEYKKINVYSKVNLLEKLKESKLFNILD